MFKLFDKDENYISSVENVTSARHIEEINGEDTLELSLIEKELTESEKAKEVDKLYGLPEGTMESAGRNLIPNSNFSKGVLDGWYPPYGTHQIKNSFYIVTLTSAPAASRAEYYTGLLEPGTYTFSMLAKSEKGFRYNMLEGTEYELKNIEGSQGFKISYITFEVTEPQQVYIRMYFNNPEVGDTMEIDWVKLEKTTPWLEEQINLEGRNLLLNSATPVTNAGYPIKIYNLTEELTEGTTVTVSIKGTLGSDRDRWGIYNSGGWVYMTELNSSNFKNGVYTKTFNWSVSLGTTTATNKSVYIFPMPNSEAPSTIEWIKLEKGSSATPWNPALEEVILWTPAPEDVDIKPREIIEKGYKIAHKTEYGHWKEFVVKEVEEMHATEGIEKRIYCESSFYETIGDYIEDKRPSGTANSALAVALEPTRWEVGTVDNLGVNATNFYQISAKEAVQKIAETWEAEIQTRVTVAGNKITHRYVDLLKKRGGDYGKRFTYSKNLESVSKIVHRDDVITALYGYGKGEEVGDGYGRRINFADINNGKAYVENNEAKEIWGRNNSDGTKSHVFSRVYFDDVEEKDLLLSLTQKKLEEVSKPLVTYQCSVASFEGIDLGDRVKIIDTEFSPEVRLAARVVKIYRDLLEKDRSVVLLGNFIPNITDSLVRQEQYINNIRSKEGVYDRADIINADGTLDAQFLNNLVNELNLKMNSQGGYVFISEDGKGLITTNAPTIAESTMAIQLVGGGFRIANSKLPNGDFNWKTFGDGDGFVADQIVAGVLQGGKVKFDLTNGTFLIGESTEDYLIYFDGTNLNFAQGREYTWEDIDADNKTWNDLDADNKTWLEIIRSPLYNPYQLTHDLGVLESDFGRTLSLISDEETLDMIERAIGGKTLIKGGYINTQLVAAQSILANMIKVNDLSAISANIGTVIAGLLKSANGESYFDLSNNKIKTSNAEITGGNINITTNDDYYNFIKLSSPNVYSITAPGQFMVRNSDGRFSDIEGHGAFFGSYSGGLRTDNVAISCSSGLIQTNDQIQAKGAIFTDDQIQAKGAIFTDDQIVAKGAISTDGQIVAKGAISTDGRVQSKQLTAGDSVYTGYMLSVYGGNAYISGSLSAETIIDRTPCYDGNALEELSRVKDDGNGGIDHSTLPKFAQVRINQEVLDNSNATSMELQREEKTKEVQQGVNFQKSIDGIDNIQNSQDIQETIVKEVEGRDIGAMVSVLTKAVQELVEKNEEQDILINELQKTLKEVKYEEDIDNNNITDNNHRHI